MRWRDQNSMRAKNQGEGPAAVPRGPFAPFGWSPAHVETRRQVSSCCKALQHAPHTWTHEVVYTSNTGAPGGLTVKLTWPPPGQARSSVTLYWPVGAGRRRRSRAFSQGGEVGQEAANLRQRL